MSPLRLLFASTEPPAVGGSSTASYALFRRVLGSGIDVHYLIAIDQDSAAYFKWLMAGSDASHGERLPVSWCWLNGPLHGSHPELAEIVQTIDPTIIVGFGYLAAGLLKSSAPWRRVVLVTGTCRQAQDYVTSGRARDAISLRRQLAESGRPPRLVNGVEQRAVESCDLVVTHSSLTLEMMEGFYPWAIGKIYPRALSFAEWICEDAHDGLLRARPFDARDIDLLLIASDWCRVEKNYSLVRKIARRLAGFAIHIVGDTPGPIQSAVHHGFVASRAKVFQLFGRARTVVCPSLIDAAPGVLFEASAMGCNLVASRNCGNWQICHPDLLVSAMDPDMFADAIRLARGRQYADRCQQFLEQHGCQELLAILTALSQPIVAEVMA